MGHKDYGGKARRQGVLRSLLLKSQGWTSFNSRTSQPGQYEFDAIALRHWFRSPKVAKTPKSISFCSLQENLDTTTSSGKLIFHLFGALAEFERELIRERTRAGLKAARTRGHKGGRPRKLNIAQIKMAKLLISEGSTSVTEICRTLGISRSTL